MNHSLLYCDFLLNGPLNLLSAFSDLPHYLPLPYFALFTWSVYLLLSTMSLSLFFTSSIAVFLSIVEPVLLLCICHNTVISRKKKKKKEVQITLNAGGQFVLTAVIICSINV